jgi:DNA-binding IclR family transcriptional regulator
MADADGSGAGLKSLDAALGVLAQMASADGAQSLSDIARACGMPRSKVHRYLASFVAAGLAQQRDRSGLYDLGKEAIHLGLAALARHDFVNHAAEDLPDLALGSGMTVLLSVWGNDGATVVRWERGVSPAVTSTGLGTTLPLLNSATGRAFLAWAPDRAIGRIRDQELRRAARNPTLLPDVPATRAGLQELVARAKRDGYTSVDGDFIPGLVALAAPVLDWQGEAQAVISLIGVDPAAIQKGSDTVKLLIDYCDSKSIKEKSAG